MQGGGDAPGRAGTNAGDKDAPAHEPDAHVVADAKGKRVPARKDVHNMIKKASNHVRTSFKGRLSRDGGGAGGGAKRLSREHPVGAPGSIPLNDWGMTQDEEFECLDDLKVQLSESTQFRVKPAHLQDERKLLRFLRARNFDVDKARDMFIKHLRFREEQDVDGLLLSPIPERTRILELFPQGYHMADKAGRPVYIQYAGQLQIHKLLREVPEDQVIKLFVQENEKFVHFKLPACSEAMGRYIEQSFTIIDVKGVSLKMLNKESQRMLKKITSITQVRAVRADSRPLNRQRPPSSPPPSPLAAFSSLPSLSLYPLSLPSLLYLHV